MTAEPSGPQPDLAALDRRLRAVEHRQEHELSQEIAATGEAVRLLHDGLREVDRGVARAGQRLDQVAAEMSTVARSQVEHGAALATLAGKVDGLDAKVGQVERKVDAQADVLASVAAQVGAQGETLAAHGQALGSLERKVDSHGEMLAGHGEMLAEILRRLPGAGD
jgi:chromosome segregation ATPase